MRCLHAGIPRGFGFVGYEDQRSTILAVDNANGMKLLQRTLRVDHCKDFRPPTSGEKGEVGLLLLSCHLCFEKCLLKSRFRVFVQYLAASTLRATRPRADNVGRQRAESFLRAKKCSHRPLNAASRRSFDCKTTQKKKRNSEAERVERQEAVTQKTLNKKRQPGKASFQLAFHFDRLRRRSRHQKHAAGEASFLEAYCTCCCVCCSKCLTATAVHPFGIAAAVGPRSAAQSAAAAYQPTGAEGGGINKHLITKRERELHQSRQQQKKLQDQRQQHDLARAAAGSKDVDEMWAEEFELMLSNLHEKADAEVKDLIRTDKRLKKKLKKEKKLLKKAAKRRASCSSSNSSSSSRSRSNSRKRSRTRQCEPPEKQTGEQEQRYTNATTSSSSRQPDANDSSKTSAHTSSSSSSGSSSRRHHGSREADERSSSRHAKSEEDVKREKAEEDRHSTDKSGDRDREKRRSSRRSRSRHRA
ncbi:hypothetical protein Efla_005413 [Eimeria flavescens]